jgi:hypothetical protein
MAAAAATAAEIPLDIGGIFSSTGNGWSEADWRAFASCSSLAVVVHCSFVTGHTKVEWNWKDGPRSISCASEDNHVRKHTHAEQDEHTTSCKLDDMHPSPLAVDMRLFG